MTDAARIREALAALCFRAGVAPADGSEAAGRAVFAAVARELRAHPTDVLLCPVQQWLSERLPDVRGWVHAGKVILPGAGRLVERRRKRRSAAGERDCERVALPAAVACAVRLFDEFQVRLPEVA